MAGSALQTMLHLQALLDLAGIYRTWNSKYHNWSVFGQDHVARVLLEYPEAQTHDAVGDALKSIRLYNLSRQLQQDPAVWQQAQVKFELNQSVFHGCFQCTFYEACHLWMLTAIVLPNVCCKLVRASCRSSCLPNSQNHRLQRSIRHMKGAAWAIARRVYVAPRS